MTTGFENGIYLNVSHVGDTGDDAEQHQGIHAHFQQADEQCANKGNIRGLALSELAAATSLHASTAHRLLASLVGRGYARKDLESGRYRLTLRLYETSRRGQRVEKFFSTR